MILVRAAAGLVIELAPGPKGLFDSLSVKLAGQAPEPLLFEARESGAGRLLVRPLEAHEPGELTAYLGAIADNESRILAEVRKYRPLGG